jgi:predicted  nucleic acid-binding Zn-ribbon protein
MFFYQVVTAYYENEIFDLNREKTSVEQELVDVKAQLETAEKQSEKYLQQLMEVKTELRSFLRTVEELLQRRAPELIDAYRQVAGSAPEIPAPEIP